MFNRRRKEPRTWNKLPGFVKIFAMTLSPLPQVLNQQVCYKLQINLYGAIKYKAFNHILIKVNGS